MVTPLRSVFQGAAFHAKGIRFAFKHPSFLFLSFAPFLLALAVYGLGFYLFTQHADALLRSLWDVDPEAASRYVGWLYWAYIHIVKFFLYFLVLIIMFYMFIVLSMVLASPVYDYICVRYERLQGYDRDGARTRAPAGGVLTTLKEEGKKVLLILAVPLPLLFIPIIGGFLGFAVASVFIAWDYVDFSLSKDCPLLKERIKTLWRHKALFLGFGFPILVPVLGLFVMPFAILGATRLYHERIKDEGTGATHASLRH